MACSLVALWYKHQVILYLVLLDNLGAKNTKIKELNEYDGVTNMFCPNQVVNYLIARVRVPCPW